LELLPDSSDREVRRAASGRRLAYGAIWNLAGTAIPLLVAAIVVPLLIRNLGTARYGLLALAWGIVGYFTIFNAGLDSALTKLVAERVGQDAQDEINGLFYTGFVLLGLSGALAGCILFLLARPLAYSWLRVPSELHAEACSVLRIFALALPFIRSAGVALTRRRRARHARSNAPASIPTSIPNNGVGRGSRCVRRPGTADDNGHDTAARRRMQRLHP